MAAAWLGTVCLGVGGACTAFPDQPAPTDWSPQAQPPPEKGPVPQEPGGLPEANQGGQSKAPTSMRPPQGCTDFDPAVIGTCMNALSAIAALPAANGQPSALVGERSTGRVLHVSKGADPTRIAKLDVSTTQGGGLLGIALSPSYNQDQQIYALISTPRDNRVVRFASGGRAKPVLTGIPPSPHGALTLDRSGALLVATSDGGDSAAAKNEQSLAGKVLRIDANGKPAPNNPNPTSRVFADGVHNPDGLCSSADGQRIYLTDRGSTKDSIFPVTPGTSLREPLWTWTNHPNVGGCAVFDDQISVATKASNGLQNLRLDKDGTLTGKPFTSLTGKNSYGRFSALDLASEQYAVGVTANKSGTEHVSSDDRAVLILKQDGSSSGRD